ncbi:ParA family protein [Pseudacidovorax intermedius]|uniref:ParA family protein n=1 Tax=Pseudacidovorax intermedius TaxID=433924 RepID=UPI0009EB3DD5|nr:AAA family ATPase [Pseudacidovorax intermedius]
MPNAIVVSLINMKGGVGKTTLAVGLAWELAMKGRRVLLVDIDPQFNATQWIVDTATYLGWLKNRHTVLNIFMPNGIEDIAPAKPTPASAIIPVIRGGHRLDVLPSTLDLMKLDAAPRGTENRLRVFLDKVRSSYEYILIDCPPTASLFSYSAFLSSDAYLVPIKPDPLSVLGLPLLERAMQDYEDRAGQALYLLGLVFCQVRQTEAMTDTMKLVRRQYAGQVFEDTIGQTTGVAEAADKNLPLQLSTKGGKFNEVKTALNGICREFENRVAALL